MSWIVFNELELIKDNLWTIIKWHFYSVVIYVLLKDFYFSFTAFVEQQF